MYTRIMNNENIFTKNFRDVQNQSPKVLTEPERNNPTFVRNKDPLPENYGYQQNLIGSLALGALLGLVDPVMFPYIVGGTMALQQKPQTNKNEEEVEIDEGSKIIDSRPYPILPPFLENFRELPQPIPPSQLVYSDDVANVSEALNKNDKNKKVREWFNRIEGRTGR